MSSCWLYVLLLAAFANTLSAVWVNNGRSQTTRPPYAWNRALPQTTRSLYVSNRVLPQTTKPPNNPMNLLQQPQVPRSPYNAINWPQQPQVPRSPNKQIKNTHTPNNRRYPGIVIFSNNGTQNSTFVTYVCNKGVCVRRYTVGFYSTVSVGGLCGLIILIAIAVAAARRRQATALHYSIISDADSRPVIGGHGLSIQCDPVLLARV